LKHKMKILLRKIENLLLIVLIALSSNGINAQTTLDNFADGNYTASPVWTVAAGSVSVVSNALVTASASAVKLSTPFTTDAMTWTIDLKSSNAFNSNLIQYFFILKDNADPTNAAADGYYIEYSSTAGDIWLKRLDNSVATTLTNGYSEGSESLTTSRTISISRSASNVFTVSVNGSLRITSSADATYASSAVQYQAIRTINTGAYTWTIDNITYTASCNNPTAAGTIGNAQSSCGSFNPTTLTSVSAASGNTGTLEYKWQSSTTSNSSGFSDIASSNAVTYDPSTITQTTWFKRLS